MMEKKPLKDRLKQDLAIVLALMLFAGGSLAAFAGNPMFLPLVALFLIATFGPYAWEFACDRAGKNAGGSKVVIKGVRLKGGERKVTVKQG